MGDVRGLAGCDALRGGQHTGKQAGRLDAGKGRELLGPGGQQEIAAGVCKKLCGVCGRLKDHTPRRERAFGPEQAVVFDAGGFTRRPDVFGGVHRIGMGGVHAEGGPLQQGGHFLRRQPPAVDGDTLQTALLFGSQRVATLTRTSAPCAASWRENRRPSVVPLNTTIFMRDTPSV